MITLHWRCSGARGWEEGKSGSRDHSGSLGRAQSGGGTEERGYMGFRCILKVGSLLNSCSGGEGPVGIEVPRLLSWAPGFGDRCTGLVVGITNLKCVFGMWEPKDMQMEVAAFTGKSVEVD